MHQSAHGHLVFHGVVVVVVSGTVPVVEAGTELVVTLGVLVAVEALMVVSELVLASVTVVVVGMSDTSDVMMSGSALLPKRFDAEAGCCTM